jgi:hypothetical protein
MLRVMMLRSEDTVAMTGHKVGIREEELTNG